MTGGDSVYRCPACSGSLAVIDETCRSCGNTGERVHGIPSFTGTYCGRFDISHERLEELARVAEDGAEPALLEHYWNTPGLSRLYSEVFDGLSEDWRLMVPKAVRGRTLDLFAGFGKRSLLLADHAKTVHAVDPCLASLRVLAASKHHLAGSVRPVHADEDTLPFADSTFDTIVVDPSRCPTPFTVLVSRLSKLLAPAGNFVLKCDGLLAHPRVTEGVGLTHPSPVQSSEDRVRISPRRVRKTARKLGFAHCHRYALFPTQTKGRYVLGVDDGVAFEWLLRNEVSSRSGLWGDVLARGLSAVRALRILEDVLPSYLAVYSDRSAAELSLLPVENSDLGFLLMRGKERATILHLSGDGIEAAEKRPKSSRSILSPSKGHSNEHEAHVLNELRSRGGSITETLPAGGLEHTEIGPVWTEQPAAGRTLTSALAEDPNAFGTALEAVFRWIMEFQRTYRGDRYTRSASQIVDDLSFEPFGVEGPAVQRGASVFTTPSVGDFSPDNIFVDPESRRVTTVIDWEGAQLEDVPFHDPAYAIISIAALTFGDFKSGFRTVLLEDSAYAEIAGRWIRTYCAEMELDPRVFVHYLAYPYVRGLKRSRSMEAEIKYTWGNIDVGDRIEFINSNLARISERLENGE